jgi:hypothetical protein
VALARVLSLRLGEEHMHLLATRFPKIVAGRCTNRSTALRFNPTKHASARSVRLRTKDSCLRENSLARLSGLDHWAVHFSNLFALRSKCSANFRRPSRCSESPTSANARYHSANFRSSRGSSKGRVLPPLQGIALSQAILDLDQFGGKFRINIAHACATTERLCHKSDVRNRT